MKDTQLISHSPHFENFISKQLRKTTFNENVIKERKIVMVQIVVDD